MGIKGIIPPEDIGDRYWNPIDDAPEHAAALGRLLVHWADIERFLIHILRYLLSIDWYKATFVYEEFVSTKSKIILLRRLNHFFNNDESIKEEIDRYLSQALKLNTQRNTYIHSSWGGNVNKLIRLKTIPHPDHRKISKHRITKPTPKDIQDVVEEIAKLSLSFYDLIYRLSLFQKGPFQE